MNRYLRQTTLPEIGATGQQALREARVVVIGCGALGSIASMYLAGAGVGTLVIADYDTIDLTNLQRQLTYTEADLGKSKALTLKARIEALNSEIKVEAVDAFVRPQKLSELLEGATLVVEASDNPDTKYMVADACAELGLPCVLGGVDGWRGQVLVQTPGATAYRDLFPEADEAGFTPCSIGGVMGPVPGIIGSIEAVEAIKVITGAGDTLAGRLLVIDTLQGSFSTISLQ